ncbi:MAG: hypothetical protein ABSF69_22960 [Polyangiaceae bacterium]
MGKWGLVFSVCVTASTWVVAASGEPPEPVLEAPVRFSEQPPDGDAQQNASPSLPALGEALPPRPRTRGLVLESTLGVLGFAGEFRHVAPPAYWFHTQLGYEIGWLMMFVAAEVALTDTTESLDESQSMGFAMWGFSGGVRATMHATERVAFYLQAEVGALTADVPRDALVILGFRHAETLNPSYGSRVGVEWYQTDRHLALFAALGGRLAEGLAKTAAPSDLPLGWDAGAGFRYTF